MNGLEAAIAGGRPLVSVVIPVFNQGDFVGDAIRSVLEQTYAPLELVVINDGSTDNTARVLHQFEGRARILDQPNRGAAAALNRGIRESRGPLVCWLSADDEFLPGKLEAQVAAFEGAPRMGMVHTGYERVDGEGRHLETIVSPPEVHPDPFVTVFWRNSLNGSTVMLRREVFEETGGFDESLRADVDADMWLKIIRRWGIGLVPGVYVRYRVHSNSLSANTTLMVVSMETVRRRNLAELRRRVGVGHRAARLLAVMSGDIAEQGLFGTAWALRGASLRAGLAPLAMARSVLAEATSRLKGTAQTRKLGRLIKRRVAAVRSVVRRA